MAEGINNKVRVIQRRAYGIKDREYLKLENTIVILTGIMKIYPHKT
ncbi:MAG: transposase [Candidatus Brocadia sp.]